MRFAQPNRLSFGRSPPEEEASAGKIAKGMNRRTVQLVEAEAILSCIPAAGESLHALMTGRYDLMHLIIALIDRIGHVAHLRIATLSYSVRNLAELVLLLDGKKADRITLLCSAFFRDHNKKTWKETVEAFRARGQKTAADRSHAKVVCFDGSFGKMAMEGSANLRSNGNREQFALIRDDALHDWHADWIDDLVDKGQGKTNGEECQQSPG